jgi:serine phosphatase RsbU (regulator of sigma subunit)
MARIQSSTQPERTLLTVEIGIAKTNKYASRDSGDTAEVVERPGGGLSVVLVDGQGSGAAAKTLSNALAGKAVTMLKEGARDGVVARATHDYLHHYRAGQVSATLDIVSVDLVSRTLVICRNSECPMVVVLDGQAQVVANESSPIGPHRHARPAVYHYPVTAGTGAVIFTDGIARAGQRAGRTWLATTYLSTPAACDQPAPMLATCLLEAALAADDQRANDDMTVVAVSIVESGAQAGPLVRRMAVTLPLDALSSTRLAPSRAT